MTDGAEAYIRCLPTAELARSYSEASERAHCVVCDVEVWLDPALVAEVQAQHPDSEIVIHCRTCPVPATDVEFSPGQVRRLRAQGADDEDIAELFALAKISGPSGDLNATRLRIAAARPLDPEFRAFLHALEEARIYVALTLP
jgi:hypothetical protein